LPQNEAKGYNCPSGTYACGITCGQFCRPTGDLYRELLVFCCYNSTSAILVRNCCDCCS
jgi:hypothetical protein